MKDKRTETHHPSKKILGKSKALHGAAKAINEPMNIDYNFVFDGTQYVAIPKGGNYNVKV